MADAGKGAMGEELEQFFTLSLDLLCIADLDGRFRRLNPQWEKALGYAISELEGSRFLDLVHPDDLEATLAVLRDLSDDKEVHDFVNRYRCKDGSYKFIEWRSRPIGDRVLAVARDVTGYKSKERLHARARQRLDFLLAMGAMYKAEISEILDFALDAAVVLTESELGYIYFYDEEARLFTLHAWSHQAMAACAVVERQTIYELDKTGLWGEAVRQRKTITVNDFAAENPFKRGVPAGHVGLRRFLTYPVMEGERIVAVVGVANKVEPYDDIDETQLAHLLQGTWQIVQRNRAEMSLRERETQLAQATRLASLGTLASGMAHEILNPLAAAISLSGSVRKILNKTQNPDEALYALLDRQGVALQRISDIVRSLKSCVRPDPSPAAKTDLHAVVEGIVDMLRAELYESDIALVSELTCSNPIVAGDPGEIRHVLLHLISNARDAVREKRPREGGRIRVATRDDAQCAVLSVIDNGTGMDSSLSVHIFDPFFTTKNPGQGTGLGLTIVHSIIASIGGDVRFDSKPGEGTRVEVVLPRT